ncbi:MAG TPA: F0F1 ATP synthase subunit gamma [Candidatus Saccharimonadales bacterium]|nr:F0F1 ATP synthase subunit gamma [Candidatus Saccharimonadales bacterium]
MGRLNDIQKETEAMVTIVELTGVFESLASMKIAKVKNQVLQSTQFFNELWSIYTQLRVDKLFRYGRGEHNSQASDRQLIIIITSEGGFSGDIDQRLVEMMLKDYDADRQDIIVIGRHGANQLDQRGVLFKKYFALPEKDQNINTEPITLHIQQYADTVVYYQEYISLMTQEVKKISVNSAVSEIGSGSEQPEGIISEDTYIFEPSTYAVIGHLERSMMKIAMSQLILQSKLAQYASRFRAMSASHDAANESLEKTTTRYNRMKRSIKDDRIKETINGMKKSNLSGGIV